MRRHFVLAAVVSSSSGCIFDWKYTGQDTEADPSSSSATEVTTGTASATDVTGETGDTGGTITTSETSSPTDSVSATDPQTETSSTETEATSTPAAVCGNGECEDGEDSMNCEQDCPVPSSCGNGECDLDMDENYGNCPRDCPAVCGNDVVEADEACDDGKNGQPAESADCDADCTESACGDGVMNMAAGEVCDDGNMDNLDGCVACALASCGDGFVLPGVEECDDGNGDDNACDSMCEVPRRTVFVTSTLFKGGLGGLAGADAKCQARAVAAMLDGNFQAWLSDGVAGPADRFEKEFAGFYELVDGTVVANGWADLSDGSLQHAIDQDETGAGMVDAAPWSNTDVMGAPQFAKHCVNWTSSSAGQKGPQGYTMAIDEQWTLNIAEAACSSDSPLYCFEDPA